MRVNLVTGSTTERWIGLSLCAPREWHKLHCHLAPGRPKEMGLEWAWEASVEDVRKIVRGLHVRRDELRSEAKNLRVGPHHHYDVTDVGSAIEDLESQLAREGELPQGR